MPSGASATARVFSWLRAQGGEAVLEAFVDFHDEASVVAGSWAGAIVDASDDADGAFTFARMLGRGDLGIAPLLLLVRGSQLPELESRHELFEDFCVTPFHPMEFEARLRHLLTRQGVLADDSETIVYKALVLNLETYQASIDDDPLDLTYMEYELLKFLAQNPGRVFTRETLLSRVWGYSKLQTGLSLLPGPIISGFVTAMGGKLSERFGHSHGRIDMTA